MEDMGFLKECYFFIYVAITYFDRKLELAAAIKQVSHDDANI